MPYCMASLSKAILKQRCSYRSFSGSIFLDYKKDKRQRQVGSLASCLTETKSNFQHSRIFMWRNEVWHKKFILNPSSSWPYFFFLLFFCPEVIWFAEIDWFNKTGLLLSTKSLPARAPNIIKSDYEGNHIYL